MTQLCAGNTVCCDRRYKTGALIQPTAGVFVMYALEHAPGHVIAARPGDEVH